MFILLRALMHAEIDNIFVRSITFLGQAIYIYVYIQVKRKSNNDRPSLLYLFYLHPM